MTTIQRVHGPLARLSLLGAVALAAGVTAGTAGATTTSPVACSPAVSNGVLPPWARGGFSEAKPRIAHITGKAGTIMAILFAQPLESPPAKTHNNKILWVANVDTQKITDLTIHAQRMVGRQNVGSRVLRVVHGGPGPSIIDLPAAGCWRFGLRWAGHTDTLDVRYVLNKA
jgi:hypothetical protein